MAVGVVGDYNIKKWALACVFSDAGVWCVYVCALLIGRGMVQAWECCLLRKNKLLFPISVSLSPFSCEMGMTCRGKEK